VEDRSRGRFRGFRPTIVPRTEGYTNDATVWDLSIVQGAFSVAPSDSQLFSIAVAPLHTLTTVDAAGQITSLEIPRPSVDGSPVPGLGKVFVQYANLEGSMKARATLNGRKFGGKVCGRVLPFRL
jgi:hypothetical protein